MPSHGRSRFRLLSSHRLMALAHRFQGLLARGEVQSMADLARLGGVTRARITQIMDLLLLAPETQESLLFLPPVEGGHDPIHLRELRYVCQAPEWEEQRKDGRRSGTESTSPISRTLVARLLFHKAVATIEGRRQDVLRRPNHNEKRLDGIYLRIERDLSLRISLRRRVS